MAVQQTRRALAPNQEAQTLQGQDVRQRDRHYLHLQRLQASNAAPEERLASFLGWFSISLGLAEVLAPKALGKLIAKLHVKDFKLNTDGHGGNFVHPRDGSIDWPAVRHALDKVGYNGWATIEDGGLPLAEFARRFDLIEAGK